jgi:hypothetical protein
VDAWNQGVSRMQDSQKDGIQQTNQPHEHPHGNGQGQPHQQAGDEILFEAAVFHGVLRSVRSGASWLNGTHKRLRSLQRSMSWVQEMLQQEKRQMMKNPHPEQVLRWKQHQQRFLLRPAQRQHRRL